MQENNSMFVNIFIIWLFLIGERDLHWPVKWCSIVLKGAALRLDDGPMIFRFQIKGPD